MYLYIFLGLIILIVIAVSYNRTKSLPVVKEHLEDCQYGVGSATPNGNAYFTNSMLSAYFQKKQSLDKLERNNVDTRKTLDNYKDNVLKSNSEYAGLDTQYNNFNNNMDAEFSKMNQELDKNKIKARDMKQSSTSKFNSIDSSMSDLVGSPGDDLESKLSPFVETAIKKTLDETADNAMNSIDKNEIANRWTTNGSGNIHSWQIVPGQGCPMRVDPASGNIQCLSYNGKTCETDYVSKNGNDLSKIDVSRVNPVMCKGDDYNSAWCQAAYNALSKNLTQVDWEGCPIDWKSAGGASCNAPSNYSGPCSKISGFSGYSAQQKQGWAEGCKARWPFKINVLNAASSLSNMPAEISKTVQGKLGNLVPKSKLNNLSAYNYGVFVKAYKLKTSDNSRGDLVQDGLITTNINFNWGVGLIFGIRENNNQTNTDALYMELTGFIKVPGAATSLKFRLTSDDGSRLIMSDNAEISNMKLLIDMWQNGSSSKESSPINVRANVYLPYVVQYFERDSSANLKLEWSINGAAFVIIPREAFFINRDICNYQFNFDYVGQADNKAQSVIPRIPPLIPLFNSSSYQSRNSEGTYAVGIYRAYSYPCYNISTSGYINGGSYGSIFDNNDTTGVDMEAYAQYGSSVGLPYRIAVFMPVSKIFKGKVRMNLVTPWGSCLPRTMTLNTMSLDQNTVNSYINDINSANNYFGQSDIKSSYLDQIDLGQIGDQNQVNQSKISQAWDLNITNAFNVIVFEITSHWGAWGRAGGAANSVWMTSIQFDTIDAPITQPNPSNNVFSLLRSKGWLDWRGSPQLLYKATRDGWDANAFHSRANNRGATITIATLTDGRIVGAFNPLPFQSINNYRGAPTAFLFDNNDRYSADNGAVFSSYYAVYDGSSYGPTFGGGHDFLSLYYGAGMQRVQGNVYTFQNSRGVGPFGTGRTQNWNVVIKELEIYGVSDPISFVKSAMAGTDTATKKQFICDTWPSDQLTSADVRAGGWMDGITLRCASGKSQTFGGQGGGPAGSVGLGTSVSVSEYYQFLSKVNNVGGAWVSSNKQISCPSGRLKGMEVGGDNYIQNLTLLCE
jgi:CPW-WPC domain-containing protein